MGKVTAVFDSQNPLNVQVTINNGVTTVKKTVRIEDYLESFVKKTEHSDTTVYRQIPTLPKHAVHLWWCDENTYKVLLELPKGVRATPFGTKGNIFLLPYPKMLMMFQVSSGKMTGSNIYCTMTDFAETGKDTPLFYFPYGNVSTGGGSICWGNIAEARTIRSFKDIERNVGLFFSATMNADLYQKDRSTKANVPIEELIGMLKGRNEFPEELMNPVLRTAGEVFGID